MRVRPYLVIFIALSLSLLASRAAAQDDEGVAGDGAHSVEDRDAAFFAEEANDEPPMLLDPPPPEVAAKLPFAVGAVIKSTVTLQRPSDSQKMDKWVPQLLMGLIMGGRINRHFGMTTGFALMAMPKRYDSEPVKVSGELLDFFAVMHFEPASWFNISAGHMSVPADRAGLSTPFNMAAWNYPGQYNSSPFGLTPKTETFFGISSSNGGVLWGQLLNNHIKYYVGDFLQQIDGDAVATGRLQINFLNPEPGYTQRSQYYGARGNILSIGASVQYQRNGSSALASDGKTTVRSDFLGGNVDMLVELKLGSAGVLDLEGAGYMFEGEYERFDYFYWGLASYLLPFKVGIGRLQPLVRVQRFHDRLQDNMYTTYDAQLGYPILDDRIRAAVGYSRQQNAKDVSARGQSIFFGLQLMKY